MTHPIHHHHHHTSRRPAWRPLRAVLSALVLLATLGAIGRSAPPAAATPPPDTGQSLRVLSYNTAFLWADLPGGCGGVDLNEEQLGAMSYKQRAMEIAKMIKQTDNDVVVLNEVFSDEVKGVLVNELALKGDYPNYISKISKPITREVPNALLVGLLGPLGLACLDYFNGIPNGTTTVTGGDSGLMVFLKKGLEFTPFSAAAQPPYNVDTVEGVNNQGPWKGPGKVAVDSYGADCSRDDCLASKAAAMVRVRSPFTNQNYNLAFTHMQAWNEPAQVQAREEQFKVMRKLITNSLTPDQISKEPVYLTGDLNVPGQNKLTGSPGSEWTKIFNSSNSSSGPFYACGVGPCTYNPLTKAGTLLTDGWGFDTSTEDKGITNYADEARLDYFLHNFHKPTSPKEQWFCLQHVMRAFDLEAGVSPLSDHFGLRADVNRRAPHCSPDDTAGVFGPQPVTLDSSGNFSGSGAIGVKGGMQWFKLDKGQGWGTNSFVFSINPNSPDPNFSVDYDVYRATDLSTPISMYNDVPGLRGDKYSLPEPPYYIRVFGTNKTTGEADRTVTGGYTLTVHENRGLSPEDAIAVSPGHEAPYPWPALSLDPNSGQASGKKDNVTFSPDTEVWFSFKTDTGSGGKFPVVDFLAENNLNAQPDNEPPFSTRVRADSKFFGYPVLAGKSDYVKGQDWDGDGKLDYRLAAPDLPGSGQGPTQYFVTVKRGSPVQGVDIRSFTTFRTTLTYINTLQVNVLEEKTWGPAPDDAYFQWTYDGPGTDTCVANCYGPASLNDDAHWEPNSPLLNGRFADYLTPRVWVGSDQLKALCQVPAVHKILHMNENQKNYVRDHVVWAECGQNPDNADYWYEVEYCLAHDQGAATECKLTD